MQINRIKIKNFKSLKNVDVRLNNLTLITGVPLVPLVIDIKKSELSSDNITFNSFIKKSLFRIRRH
jgi:predicted ATPase